MIAFYNSGDNLIKKKCILCKNEKFQLISKKTRDSKKHKIIRCLKCNHIQLYPIPTLSDEKKFYDENLQDKNINDVGSIKRARKKIEVLHIFNPDSNHKSFQILVLMIYKRCSAMKNSMIIKKNHIVSSKIIT